MMSSCIMWIFGCEQLVTNKLYFKMFGHFKVLKKGSLLKLSDAIAYNNILFHAIAKFLHEKLTKIK